jgi:putative holliday junction resolvase
MKYLGIDYGSKKIGIAKSDQEGKFAFPYSILAPKPDMSHVKDIVNICVKEDVNDVVIGKSIDLAGKNNPIETEILAFIEVFMELSGCTIHRFDERMTTSGAQAMLRSSFSHSANSKDTAANAKAVREHTKDDDAKVAAYMLQGFLDMQNRV